MSTGTADPAGPAPAWHLWARWGGGLALVGLLLVVASLVRGPGGALQSLRQAAERRDTAALDARVDFPALKHSLGRYVLQQMGAALPDDQGDDRALLKQFFVSAALVAPLVDTLVTPEGLAALVDGQVAPRRVNTPGAPTAGPPARTDVSWTSPTTARATVLDPTGEPRLVLLMRREGLTWRLVGVERPPVGLALPAPPKRP